MQEEGKKGKSRVKPFETCLHPSFSSSELLNWGKQKKNQDIMMMNNVIRHCPPAKLFSPYNSKLNQCTITKRKFPPMDDDEMPSSFELWRTQCTMGINNFWIHIYTIATSENQFEWQYAVESWNCWIALQSEWMYDFKKALNPLWS